MKPCKCIFTIPVCENKEDHMRRVKEDNDARENMKGNR